jgi:hypothetical protein
MCLMLSCGDVSWQMHHPGHLYVTGGCCLLQHVGRWGAFTCAPGDVCHMGRGV